MKRTQISLTFFISLFFALIISESCTAPVKDKKEASKVSATKKTDADKASLTPEGTTASASGSSSSDIPLVKAKATSKDKYFDWGSRPVETEDGPADPWTMPHMMCQGPPFMDGQLKASSSLAAQANKDYSANNICDDNPTTAWVEGHPDYGIGEYLELNWTPMGNGEISILNGYQISKSTWEDNSRVKKLKVSIAGKDICQIELADVMGIQKFEIPGLVIADSKGYDYKIDGAIRFTIQEVYPGLKWKDTAISGLFSCGG